MEKGGCVRVTEGEEVRTDDPVKYFFRVGVPEGMMAVEVPQIEEIFLRGQN